MTLGKDADPWEFNVLVGAATVHDGLFLILKRSSRENFLPDVWGIPAGRVLRDEEPAKACLRELSEETGLSGQVVGLIGYSTFPSERGSVQLSNLQLNFLVEVPDCEVRLDRASHSDFRWLSLDDIDNELIDAFTRRIMISARRLYKEAGSLTTTHK